MSDMKQEKLPQDKDIHLDIPAEANREKHVNFRELQDEATNERAGDQNGNPEAERQRAWREGVEAGKRERFANDGEGDES